MLDQVGLKGKQHNTFVSLRLRIIGCSDKSYNKGIVEQVWEFVLVYVLGEQIVNMDTTI